MEAIDLEANHISDGDPTRYRKNELTVPELFVIEEHLFWVLIVIPDWARLGGQLVVTN